MKINLKSVVFLFYNLFSFYQRKQNQIVNSHIVQLQSKLLVIKSEWYFRTIAFALLKVFLGLRR